MYNTSQNHTVTTNTGVTVDNTAGGTEIAAAVTGKTSRKICLITNCSAVVMYVAVGFTPTATAYTYSMAAGTTVSVPAGMNAQIKALAASSSGNVQVYVGT